MPNDIAARVALAKAGIAHHDTTLLQAPQNVESALSALRRQAEMFEARAKLRMQGTEPDTASEGEVFDLGDDEVEIHQGSDTDNNNEEEINVNRTDSLTYSVDETTQQLNAYIHKPTNQPYDYSEEIIRNKPKLTSPTKSSVPAVWAKALKDGYLESSSPKKVQFNDEDNNNENDDNNIDDGQSSVTTDLDHIDANAIIAAAEAEVLAEMMNNHNLNDNDSNDGSSTAEADALLAAGILRAADNRINQLNNNYNDNDSTNEDDYVEGQDADTSLNSSYANALAEAERQVYEQRRMVAELRDIVPPPTNTTPNKTTSSPRNMITTNNGSTIVNDVLLTKNGLFQRLSPQQQQPISYVTTADYEMAAANLAMRNSVHKSNKNDDNNEEEDDNYNDEGNQVDNDEEEEDDEQLIYNTNVPLPGYPQSFGDDHEEESISSWTHAESENNININEAYNTTTFDNNVSNTGNASSRRLSTLRRRTRKWSAELKQRRAVALAVALRTLNSWGTSVSGSPGASAPRALRINELEELVLDIGSALTGLAPGILALGNQENQLRNNKNTDEIDEDEGESSNVLLASQNLLNPLAILSRRRKVTIAGASLHGIQAFAYTVWMTARPSLHAALLCYIGADAKAPATQKWLLRDVRTGLADWASIASAALMDTSSNTTKTSPISKPVVNQPVTSPFASPTTKAMRLTGIPMVTTGNTTKSSTVIPPPVPSVNKSINNTNTKFTLPPSSSNKFVNQPTTNAARTFTHQRFAMQSDGTWAAVEDSFSTDDGGENMSISSTSDRDLVFHSSTMNSVPGVSSNGRITSNSINIKPGGKIELRPPQPNPGLGPDDLNQHTFINAHLLASLARNMPNTWNSTGNRK